jgi:drug/metabolite transporter (DMT)-like permease
MATFILFESVPFVALAFASRRLGRWLTLGCVLAFVGVFFEVDREVSQSTSSTAALAFLVVPFVLLALLLAVLAVNEVARFAVRWRRGATR